MIFHIRGNQLQKHVIVPALVIMGVAVLHVLVKLVAILFAQEENVYVERVQLQKLGIKLSIFLFKFKVLKK